MTAGLKNPIQEFKRNEGEAMFDQTGGKSFPFLPPDVD